MRRGFYASTEFPRNPIANALSAMFTCWSWPVAEPVGAQHTRAVTSSADEFVECHGPPQSEVVDSTPISAPETQDPDGRKQDAENDEGGWEPRRLGPKTLLDEQGWEDQGYETGPEAPDAKPHTCPPDDRQPLEEEHGHKQRGEDGPRQHPQGGYVRRERWCKRDQQGEHEEGDPERSVPVKLESRRFLHRPDGCSRGASIDESRNQCCA